MTPVCLFQWDGGRLIEMGWSNCEELICIAEDGAVYVYDMFGTFQRQFSLGLVSLYNELLSLFIGQTVNVKYYEIIKYR